MKHVLFVILVIFLVGCYKVEVPPIQEKVQEDVVVVAPEVSELDDHLDEALALLDALEE